MFPCRNDLGGESGNKIKGRLARSLMHFPQFAGERGLRRNAICSPITKQNFKTSDEQIERVTVKRVKIDYEAIVLDVVRRAEKRFVFEIVRDSTFVATSDEHRTAKGGSKGW
jgi:hypothetical protein